MVRPSTSCRRAAARRRSGGCPAAQAGEATQVTRYPLDVGAFQLSPDGKQLAVALEVFIDCADLACTGRPRRRRREAPGHRPALRLAALPALGHLEGRPALAPLRGARSKASSRTGRRDEGHGRRRAVEAVRRRRGVHLHAGQPRPRLHRPRRRPRGGLVDQPRPLGRAARRQPEAAQPDRRQQGHRHRAGLLARRHAARLPVDGPRRLRGRHAAHHAGELGRSQRAAPRRSPRRGIAHRTSWSGRATARRSTPPRRTSASSRSSPSTWRRARPRRC